MFDSILFGPKFWWTHIFWTQIFFSDWKLFWTHIFWIKCLTQFYLDQNFGGLTFFGPKSFFLIENFFGLTFSGSKLCMTQNCFDPKFLLDSKCFWTQNFFWAKNGLNLIFFTQFFWTLICFLPLMFFFCFFT